jgi:hypothetical protein
MSAEERESIQSMGPGATLSFLFVLAVAAVFLAVFLVGLVAWSPWSRGPSGVEADVAASLAGRTHGQSGCTQQEGHEWFWCGTYYDWFDGFEGLYYRLTTDSNGCWIASPAHVERVNTPRRATYPRAVKVVNRDGKRLRGCVGSGDTGRAVDGPGQIPRLIGG